MLSHFLRAASIKPSAITFIGAAEGTGSGNTINVTYPAGTANGDVAIICITTNNNLSTGYSASGWTSLNAETNESSVKANLLNAVVSGTGTQTFSKSGLSPSQLSYIVAVFRNATYSNFSAANNSTGLPNPPSLTGNFNAVVVFGNSNQSDSAVTPPTGYTTLGEINNTNITTMGGYLISSSTDPNPGNFTNIASGQYVAYTIGLT
jgi:hypothetical protein